MKLHLPVSLFRTLLCACVSCSFGTATLAGGLLAAAAPQAQAATFNESNHSVTPTALTRGAVWVSGVGSLSLTITGKTSVLWNENKINSGYSVYGGVLASYNPYNPSAKPVQTLTDPARLTIANNGNVNFKGNVINISKTNLEARAAVIYNHSYNEVGDTYTDISDNGVVTFDGNAILSYNKAYGGVIYNGVGAHKLQLNGNDGLIFSNNYLRAQGAAGGAIYNEAEAEIIGNGTVAFRNNYIDSSVDTSNRGDTFGGALYLTNSGTKVSKLGETFTYGMTISNNGPVEFSSNHIIGVKQTTNTVLDLYGGAIYSNDSVLTFSGNGDISFNGNYIEANGAEGYLRGGAFYSGANSQVTFTNNGNISFTGNYITTINTSHSSTGGAIYLGWSSSGIPEQFIMSGNKDITFSGNSITAVSGGSGAAILNDGKDMIIRDNGKVTFTGNSTKITSGGSYGAAISTGGPLQIIGNTALQMTNNTISCNGEGRGGAINLADKTTHEFGSNKLVTFSGNTITANSYAKGGAIYVGNSANLTFNKNNGAITFSSNTATTTDKDAKGGAIYFDGGSNNPHLDFLLAGNLTFSSNSVRADQGTARGGAIYADDYAKPTFSGTGNILFKNNTTRGKYGYGAAIQTYGTHGVLSFTQNGSLSFVDNKAIASATAAGGALSTSFTVSMSGTDILISGNSATSDTVDADGGAFSMGNTAVLTCTGTLEVSGNSAVSKATKGTVRGGAIFSDEDLTISAGNQIIFRDNHAKSGHMAQGGALHSLYNYTYLNNTPNVTFSGNTAESTATAGGTTTTAAGGAICIYGSSTSQGTYINDHSGTVMFENNAAIADSGKAAGGAIFVHGYSTSYAIIKGNNAVRFVGNYAESHTGTASGGAIQAVTPFEIAGNKSVVFRRNYTKQGSTYRLNDMSAGSKVILSAPKGREIRFNGSVDLGSNVEINNAYTDADGVQHSSAGDVVISGTNTAADLKTIKGGVAGTAAEIQASRTSTVGGKLSINNGRLLLENGVSLTAAQLAFAPSATLDIQNSSFHVTKEFVQGTAHLNLNNAKLSTGNYLSSKEVSISGCNELRAANSASGFSGSTWTMSLSKDNLSTAAVTLVSDYRYSNAIPFKLTALTLTSDGELASGRYKLLSYDTSRVTWKNEADTVIKAFSKALTIGDDGVSDLYFTTDGNIRTLMLKRAASLTWTGTSGTWKTNAAFGKGTFRAEDYVSFTSPATVTISGAVAPGSVTVGNTTGTVTFKAATTSSRIAGKTKLTKNGAGTLTMNNGNTYTGGTVINAGTVNAGGATSFGTGTITVKGGTLNLGSHAVANAIKVTGTSTLKGSAYKGALTIAANLGSGTNLTRSKTTTLSKGTVSGVLAGAAGVKVTGEATLAGKNTYKGITSVAAGALLHLTGTVAGNYSVSGTLDASQKAIALGSGKTMTVADGGVVTGKVTVNSGATLTVKGTKSKLGTTVVNGGTAVLNSTAATIQATGSGVATVYGKKLTLGTTKSTLKMAAKEAVNLNSGKMTVNSISTAYTGNLVAKGGTLDLASRTVTNNVYLYKATLGHAGALRGTLCVRDAAARYSGSLTLTSNNKLNFTAGSKLTVTGTLTLKGGTALTLAGSGWKAGSYTIMSAGALSVKTSGSAFYLTQALSGYSVALSSKDKNLVLTLRSTARAAAAPAITAAAAADVEPELDTAAAEPALAAEPTVTAPALTAETAAMADALVQADWAVVDAARAFTSGIRNRSTGTLTPDGKGAVWMNAIGSLARHSSVNGHSGSQVNLYGGAVGAEHNIGEHHSIGAAVGGTHANIGNTPMGKLRQDTTHVALYGNSRMGSKFSADWAAAFGSTNAHGNLGDARAKWQQNSTELSARLTYAEMLNDNTQLRTFAGLDYDATNADRTNGGKTGSVQALRGEFGMGLTHATETYTLYGEVGMVGDMVRHNPVAEADGFRLKGANPGRIGLKATLGGSIRLNDTWSANASYNLETAADATMQSVNVGASRKF